MRTTGGTYIRATAALGVMWAYRKGKEDDKEGKGGDGVGEKWG